MVIFGKLDLLQDAPISRVDFLLCRNTLMYFNSEAQGRILARFAFSLNPNGSLLLGRAEMLFSHSTLFTAVDLKSRLFRVTHKIQGRDRGALPAAADALRTGADVPEDIRLRHAAFETESPASWCSTRPAGWLPPTSSPGSSSGFLHAISAAPSRTSRCPIGRRSCAARSTGP